MFSSGYISNITRGSRLQDVAVRPVSWVLDHEITVARSSFSVLFFLFFCFSFFPYYFFVFS